MGGNNSSNNKSVENKKNLQASPILCFIIKNVKNDTTVFIEYVENLGATRLQRFLILVAFFLIIITLICLFSKMFKMCKLVRYRREKYGYYFSARYETAIYNILFNQYHIIRRMKCTFKMLCDKLSVLSHFAIKKRNSNEIDSIQTLLKDIGHENKVNFCVDYHHKYTFVM